jgi:hypothetical protein
VTTRCMCRHSSAVALMCTRLHQLPPNPALCKANPAPQQQQRGLPPHCSPQVSQHQKSCRATTKHPLPAPASPTTAPWQQAGGTQCCALQRQTISRPTERAHSLPAHTARPGMPSRAESSRCRGAASTRPTCTGKPGPQAAERWWPQRVFHTLFPRPRAMRVKVTPLGAPQGSAAPPGQCTCSMQQQQTACGSRPAARAHSAPRARVLSGRLHHPGAPFSSPNGNHHPAITAALTAAAEQAATLPHPPPAQPALHSRASARSAGHLAATVRRTWRPQ